MHDDPGSRRVDLFDSTYGHFTVAARWRDARQAHREALVAIEGDDAVHTLTRDRKLSRIAYLAEKPGR